MKHTYFIYQNSISGELIISDKSIPFKRKYAGIKAKIEAVKRLTNKELPENISGDDIKKYVNENFFGKPIMKEYINTLEKVKEEVDEINNVRIFLYQLQVSFTASIFPNDPHIINMIKSYIQNPNIDIYATSEGNILAINKL